MTVALSEAETTCLKKLADLYEAGHTTCEPGKLGLDNLGLLPGTLRPILGMMEQCGYITNPIHHSGGYYAMFTITASAVQAARAVAVQEKQQREGKDIVEHVKVTLRKHPLSGWAMVILLTLAAIVTALNQLVSLLKNLNWIG